MKADERDARLGELLDRAVRGIEVGGDPPPIERRGSRRRAGALVASVTTVAVFLGAVGFAATQVGRDADRDAEWTQVGDLRTDGWTMAVPGGWTHTPIDRCPPNRDVEGAVFSSVDFAFTDPDGGRINCDTRLVLGGFPADGVAIALMPTGERIGFSFPLRR